MCKGPMDDRFHNRFLLDFSLFASSGDNNIDKVSHLFPIVMTWLRLVQLEHRQVTRGHCTCLLLISSFHPSFT